jgi:hypothetical protein
MKELMIPGEKKNKKLLKNNNQRILKLIIKIQILKNQ